MTTEIEKIRTLEGAIVDLVSAIQKGDTTLSDEIDAVDEAVHKYPEWRVEIHPLERSVSAKDNTTPAIDIERPITDEVADAIAKEAEEYHKRKEQEADKAPIGIYWRKAQGEPILQTAASDFPTAERKRDELIKAGYIDIQMIVKGKKKEVVR